MAYTILPKPGSEVGPCKEACEHTDCAQTRAWADALCPKCNEAIGYERPMLLVEKTEPWHFSCYVEYIEAGGE
ncbi:hypothetical protein ES705_20563 [subsurface metagenome]